MNNFLCTYTGKCSKIAIFVEEKGLPSEDVRSNAIMISTSVDKFVATTIDNCELHSEKMFQRLVENDSDSLPSSPSITELILSESVDDFFTKLHLLMIKVETATGVETLARIFSLKER